MSTDSSPRSWVPLSPAERRVLGVLIEKQKTTPEYYPMSVTAVVTGCNQKSNRDPVTNYDSDDVEETLHELRTKGVAVLVETGGRVPKWKHLAYDWFGLKGKPEEMAVMAELLLRGPQTEGELRARASRMDEIADLAKLHTILAYLNELGLVVYLTPPGQKRGVVLTHGLYPQAELDRLREGVGRSSADLPGESSPRFSLADDMEGLKTQLLKLSERLTAVEQEVARLRAELGISN